ncbi:transcriptional activator FlhC [Citrobacter freundii]|nr:transcriptional activator FlhC [Citrobacter freundii]
MMSEKSIVQEARDIQLAMELITLAPVCKCWKAKRN